MTNYTTARKQALTRKMWGFVVSSVKQLQHLSVCLIHLSPIGHDIAERYRHAVGVPESLTYNLYWHINASCQCCPSVTSRVGCDGWQFQITGNVLQVAVNHACGDMHTFQALRGCAILI